MLQTALLAIFVPAILTGVLALVAQRFAPKLGVGLGMALGFAAGQIALVGWPGLMPVDATYRLLHLAILGALAGLVEVLWPDKTGPRWAARAVLAALVLGLLLRSVMEHTWEGGEIALNLAVLFAAFLGLAAFIDALERPTKSFEAPFLLVLLGSAAAGALVLAHSAFLGQLMGSLTATLGALGVAALIRPEIRLRDGAVPVFAAVFAGLVLCSHYYATLPLVSAVLLVLAPLAAWLGGLGVMAQRPAWQILVVRSLLLLLVAGLAVYFSYSANAVSASDPYAGY